MLKYEHIEIETEPYFFYILGVGAWGCRLLREMSNDNITEFHTLAAMDSNTDNLDASKAMIKIHIDPDTLTSAAQGLFNVANKFQVFDEYRKHFDKADLIFVLLDTAEDNFEHLMRCVGILLGKKFNHRHTLTIALISNTNPSPSKELIYANSADVTDHWRLDTLIDLSKTDCYRNPTNLNPDAFFHAQVTAHTDIISGICDPLIHNGLIAVDFSDVMRTFSNRGETFFGIGASSQPDRANQAAILACRNIENSKYTDCGWTILEKAGGVFVNIRAANMGLDEFNKVGDVIHELVGEEATLKIVNTVDSKLGDEMIVSVLAADYCFL